MALLNNFKVGDKFISNITHNTLEVVYIGTKDTIFKINDDEDTLRILKYIALYNINNGFWKPFKLTYKEEL
jgi:hypothetical protein